MKPLPSLSGIEAFDSVSRLLSFSKAGQELGITQAAVSHRIRTLEQELDVVLFLRSSRKVELTVHGQALNSATGSALQQIRSGIRYLEALSNPHRITVSCSPSFAIRWLVPHLADFRKYAPELQIHIAAEDQLVDPGFGSIDVCVRFGPGGYSGVHAEPLTQETTTAVCSPHYQEQFKLKTLKDLSKCTLLHDTALGQTDHLGWTEWIEALGGSLPSSSGLEFSHSHMALDAAIASQGIALARKTLVKRDLHVGLLVVPFEEKLKALNNYWLITPRDTELSKSVVTFREWIKAALNREFLEDDL